MACRTSSPCWEQRSGGVRRGGPEVPLAGRADARRSGALRRAAGLVLGRGRARRPARVAPGTAPRRGRRPRRPVGSHLTAPLRAGRWPGRPLRPADRTGCARLLEGRLDAGIRPPPRGRRCGRSCSSRVPDAGGVFLTGVSTLRAGARGAGAEADRRAVRRHTLGPYSSLRRRRSRPTSFFTTETSSTAERALVHPHGGRRSAPQGRRAAASAGGQLAASAARPGAGAGSRRCRLRACLARMGE